MQMCLQYVYTPNRNRLRTGIGMPRSPWFVFEYSSSNYLKWMCSRLNTAVLPLHDNQRSSQRKCREHLSNLPSHHDNATHQGISISLPYYEEKCMECSIVTETILRPLRPFCGWTGSLPDFIQEQLQEVLCFLRRAVYRCPGLAV